MKSSLSDQILHELKLNYFDPIWEQRMKPLDELIFTILTQHTSDLNAEKAYKNLMDHYQDFERLLDSDEKTVAKLIRTGGLANIKSRRILHVLSEIKYRVGKLDIDFLQDMDLQEARNWLTSIKGIGPKTASCVLAFSFGFPAIPVDTHIHRVSKRLGLISKNTSADEAHNILEAKINLKDHYKFHVLVIEHGRKVCHSRKPSCRECKIKNLCKFQRQIK